jgi:hypothetical protein
VPPYANLALLPQQRSYSIGKVSEKQKPRYCAGDTPACLYREASAYADEALGQKAQAERHTSRVHSVSGEDDMGACWLCHVRYTGVVIEVVRMNLANHIDFLDRAIVSQRTAVRFHLCLACGVLLFGVMAIVVVHLLAGTVIPENLKWLLTLGGTFFSTLSSFPVKEIFSRRDKAAAIEFLLRELQQLSAQHAPEAEEVEKLQARFWQFIDKSLGA